MLPLSKCCKLALLTLSRGYEYPCSDFTQRDVIGNNVVFIWQFLSLSKMVFSVFRKCVSGFLHFAFLHY